MEVMKQLRQRSIRDLIEQRTIRTQQELAAALREHGFQATQATISRDVAELGLVKRSRGGTVAYALPPRLIEGLPDYIAKLRIDRVYPLAEAAAAHRDLEGRKTAGKLALAVS